MILIQILAKATSILKTLTRNATTKTRRTTMCFLIANIDMLTKHLQYGQYTIIDSMQKSDAP